MACCLEAGAATITAPIVTPTFAQDIGALVFAGVSIESYGQGASISMQHVVGQASWPQNGSMPPGHGI